MTDAEKDHFMAEFERTSPEKRLAESRALNARERAFWKAFKAKAKATANRAAITKSNKESPLVSRNVEKSVLKKADLYAKQHGMDRQELILKALSGYISNSTPA